jgi:hypothetical protein
VIKPNSLSEKEHFCLSENSRFFPRAWRKMQYSETVDASRKSFG